MRAQQTDMAYILALDTDRLLAPYLREAGLPLIAEQYGNWEDTGLDGHIGGHYLTALSLMYAATGNPELLHRLNYMVDQLEVCQRKNGNGYIGGVPGGEAMWRQIANGQIDAENFSLNKKWVPWYNLHKTFAGLRDAYTIAGNAKAKDLLVRLTDWSLSLTAGLTDAQLQDMLRSEHGGMNEVFADVAEITGDAKYLQLARRFSHRSMLDPLLLKQDALDGMHANTQIPKVIGYKRVAEVAGDKTWNEAAAFFWDTVTRDRTVTIGGNSVREHFHPANDFSSMVESREGPETCNTYNMLKLSKQLYLTSASTVYLDYYERAMYNHILSSQHPDGGFVYFTPMRPRHYRVYSQPQEAFWCCVGSGLENHGKYGELIYAYRGQELFINLFVPSSLNWKEQGVRVVQHTNFPFEEASALTLKVEKPTRFALHIRRPEWVKDGDFEVLVNRKKVKPANSQTSYVTIKRKWKTGDIVTITLPMETKAEYLPDQSPWVSFVHGPIVLAAITDTTDLEGLKADGSRMGHIASGPLYPVEGAPVLVAQPSDLVAGIKPVPGKSLTFTASKLISPEDYKNVELIPFFQVHDARYMLYWPIASPDQLATQQKAFQEKEQASMALETQTIDLVIPGEQQPESDHNYKGENTASGVHQNRHWRHSSSWFSYDLRNPGKTARNLRLTYYGLDKDRNFDVYINNILVQTVHLDGTGGEKFIEETYALPESLQQAGTLTVKFVARPNSKAGGIYGVRLMK